MNDNLRTNFKRIFKHKIISLVVIAISIAFLRNCSEHVVLGIPDIANFDYYEGTLKESEVLCRYRWYGKRCNWSDITIITNNSEIVARAHLGKKWNQSFANHKGKKTKVWVEPRSFLSQRLVARHLTIEGSERPLINHYVTKSNIESSLESFKYWSLFWLAVLIINLYGLFKFIKSPNSLPPKPEKAERKW